MEDIVIELQPADRSTAELIKQHFIDEEVLESNAFTGAELITILVATGKDTLLKVLSFFTKHRESLKGASVRIGTQEVELTGYSIKEVTEFMESGNVEKIIDAMKKKK